MTSPRRSDDLRGRSTNEVLDFYRELKEPNRGYVGYSEPSLKRTLVETVSALPGSSVVDLGCGPNPVTLFELAARGKGPLTAVDLSADFCASAREQAAARGFALDVVCASVHETPFDDGSFDLAILSETLEHVPDDLELPVLQEAYRLVAPGGRLVASVPNARSLFDRYLVLRTGKPADHLQHLRSYTVPILRARLLEAGFDVERLLRVPATVEPFRHAKAAWLLDRLARRPQWSLKAAIVARRPQ